MNIGSARAAAADWVMRYAAGSPGYVGAYFSGSTVGKPDHDELAPASDIDVVIVTDEDSPRLKPGKLIHQDALLEVTYMPWESLGTPERVLGSYHLAGSFRVDSLISDPSGRLRRLQSEVSRQFADRTWVVRRCEHVRQRIVDGLRTINPASAWHEQVTSWLFPTGVTTHMLLVAALRNPTVRLRYTAVHDVLKQYGQPDLYEELLQLLGCAQMTPEQASGHLDGLARTFDAAAKVASTPFFFSSDITAAARRVAIDGSQALIQSGSHREAVFWMTATYARCHFILAADAPPEMQQKYLPLFEDLTRDLGLSSSNNLHERAADVLRYLPKLWKITMAIVDANPEVKGSGRL
ncbi:hypothetical protein [Paenibacillus sp. 7541]|uniref:hypothetical protein n=1 Tax=Paenibacillus sp. 7541 TaxID=2026236 RepID=UPI000BA6B234|nr:hypothetical protein [Paenibacillus sp. 7541]PAK49058.1 hypothetical protein CHH75_21575 [Paenibacillus sp. 7541]